MIGMGIRDRATGGQSTQPTGMYRRGSQAPHYVDAADCNGPGGTKRLKVALLVDFTAKGKTGFGVVKMTGPEIDQDPRWSRTRQNPSMPFSAAAWAASSTPATPISAPASGAWN